MQLAIRQFVRSGPRNQTDSGRRNRSTVNEFSPTERLGRGAYESPRPGTLGPTDEAVSTVTESGWPDDAHRGRCFFRWHDRWLHNLSKPAVRAVGLDGRSNGSSFSSYRQPKRTSVRGNKLEWALSDWATIASGEAPAVHRSPDQPNECRRTLCSSRSAVLH
jgi:hypothetical protein